MFLLASVVCRGGIPDHRKYDFGNISVPENYDFEHSRKLNIYWERLNSTTSNAEAIVMINGGPGLPHDSFHRTNQQGGYMRDYFEPLRNNYDIYYFDQRGTGNSSRLTWANMFHSDMRMYVTANICHDLEQLRKKVIKRDKIAVFGESYGGMVAMLYAIMYPDSVSKLVIHDSTPSNDYYNQMHRNFSRMLLVLDDKLPGVHENMLESVRLFNEGKVHIPGGIMLSGDDFLSVCLNFTYSIQGQILIARMALEIVEERESLILNALLGLRSRSSERIYKPLSPALALVQSLEMQDESALAQEQATYQPWTKEWLDERVFEARRRFKSDYMLTYFKPLDLRPKLSQIKAPTFVMVGETDFVTPYWYAEEIHRLIPDSRLLIIPNAAHGGFVEQSEFVIGRIRNFLLNRRSQDDRHKIRTICELSEISEEQILDIWLDGALRSGIR